MKKRVFIIILIVIFMLNIFSHMCVFAEGEEITQENWVQKAFAAVYSFLSEDTELDRDSTDVKERTIAQFLDLATNFIKGINKVLLVALFGISSIALSYIGIQYIWARGNPAGVQKAKKDLRTTFIAMGYGFGAFTIWKIAMAIVKVILETFAM